MIFFFIRICCNILSGISKSGQKIDLFYHLGPYIRVNNNYIVIRDVLHMIRALTDLFKLLGALVLHHYFLVITDENFCSNSFTKIFFLILPSSCYLFEVWSVTKQCMAWGMMKWGFFSVEFRELGEIIKTQCSQINEKVWNFRKSWPLKCNVTTILQEIVLFSPFLEQCAVRDQYEGGRGRGESPNSCDEDSSSSGNCWNYLYIG